MTILRVLSMNIAIIMIMTALAIPRDMKNIAPAILLVDVIAMMIENEA